MQFVPLVGTTLGRLGVDAVAMSWGLAHQAAEKAFLARGIKNMVYCRGTKEGQGKDTSVLAAYALAR
eukprot:3820748-Rhodomonas_salina.2